MVLGSGIRDPRFGIRKKPIPNPGVKKAPDPGSGSATLSIFICNLFFIFIPHHNRVVLIATVGLQAKTAHSYAWLLTGNAHALTIALIEPSIYLNFSRQAIKI
jgi:hypothetical protein